MSTDTLSTEAYTCPGKLPTMIRVEKERRAGVEPATCQAATDCSTTELTPRPYARGTVETTTKSTPTQMLHVHSRNISYIYSVMTLFSNNKKPTGSLPIQGAKLRQIILTSIPSKASVASTPFSSNNYGSQITSAWSFYEPFNVRVLLVVIKKDPSSPRLQSAT